MRGGVIISMLLFTIFLKCRPIFALIRSSLIPLRGSAVYHYLGNLHLVSYLLPFCSRTHSCHKSHGRTGPNHLRGDTAENRRFIKMNPHTWLPPEYTRMLNSISYKISICKLSEKCSCWLCGTQLGNVCPPHSQIMESPNHCHVGWNWLRALWRPDFPGKFSPFSVFAQPPQFWPYFKEERDVALHSYTAYILWHHTRLDPRDKPNRC